MVLHRPSDQWRGVVGVFGWGWDVNDLLLAAVFLLGVQILLVAIIATAGKRMNYYAHQSLCLVGMSIGPVVIVLSVVGAAVSL
jgi:hypothetical protein